MHQFTQPKGAPSQALASLAAPADCPASLPARLLSSTHNTSAHVSRRCRLQSGMHCSNSTLRAERQGRERKRRRGTAVERDQHRHQRRQAAGAALCQLQRAQHITALVAPSAAANLLEESIDRVCRGGRGRRAAWVPGSQGAQGAQAADLGDTTCSGEEPALPPQPFHIQVRRHAEQTNQYTPNAVASEKPQHSPPSSMSRSAGVLLPSTRLPSYTNRTAASVGCHHTGKGVGSTRGHTGGVGCWHASLAAPHTPTLQRTLALSATAVCWHTPCCCISRLHIFRWPAGG